MAVALGLLALFIGWNELGGGPHGVLDPVGERLPSGSQSFASRSLAFHDFESGNPADTASHLVMPGHQSKLALKLTPAAPFSPGLWIRFRDLRPGDSAWFRASGYVYFSGTARDTSCSLVATCNHNGINYKYMTVRVEREPVKPDCWNRISIDYRIPPPPDSNDVVQAYFWYRGEGEIMVDDISVDFYSPEKKTDGTKSP
jgi:hypothetical protein